MKKDDVKLCEPCSGLGFDRSVFISNALRFAACRNCGGTGLVSAKKEKDYRLNAYANGFGVWHCEIFFTTPLGNTGEAERVANNGLRAAKRRIRAEIADRMGNKPKRLAYEVVKNQTEPGIGRLFSLTIAEK